MRRRAVLQGDGETDGSILRVICDREHSLRLAIDEHLGKLSVLKAARANPVWRSAKFEADGFTGATARAAAGVRPKRAASFCDCSTMGVALLK
jgi:hypothetical protein